MKIKTRESLRTIKTFDRAKTLGQKVKNGAGEVKEYGEELQNTRYGSANEYAGNAVENTERRTARNVAYGAGIAVYAVKTNRTEDVVTFDEAKADILKEVFRSLNCMDIHTKQITAKETHLETQEDGSVVPVEQEVVKTYLYIDTVSLTAEEAANLYGFDTRQREQLGELLSDKNKEMWDRLQS